MWARGIKLGAAAEGEERRRPRRARAGAAMADKPSRALVLYAAGHAALLTPPTGSAAAGSHLDAFASRASCGFLTLRSPPASPPTTGTDPARLPPPHLCFRCSFLPPIDSSVLCCT